MSCCNITDSHSAIHDEKSKPRKLKVFMEEAKARQTTHWDMDYMTRAELDALLLPKSAQQSSEKTSSANSYDWLHRKFEFALLVMAVSSGLWLGFLMQ